MFRMIPGVPEPAVAAAAQPAMGASIRTKAAAGLRVAAAAAAITSTPATVPAKALVILATAVVAARSELPNRSLYDLLPPYDSTKRYDRTIHVVNLCDLDF